MTDFFRIEFDGIGFPFGTQLIGTKVAIQWEGQNVVGRVWSLSYAPSIGYYGIGIRVEPKSLPDEPQTRVGMKQSNLTELLDAKNG